jgi:hypothetical protein
VKFRFPEAAIGDFTLTAMSGLSVVRSKAVAETILVYAYAP